MNVIQKFNEYSAIIECGAGYGEQSRVDRDRLIDLLRRLPAGDIILSTAPHDEGRAVIVKPDRTDLLWHVLTPTVPEEKKKSIYERAREAIGL